MAKQWSNVGTISGWSGKESDILIFKENGKVAIGVVTGGSFDNPFITDTFFIDADKFTMMVKQMANIALDGQMNDKPGITAVAEQNDTF